MREALHSCRWCSFAMPLIWIWISWSETDSSDVSHLIEREWETSIEPQRNDQDAGRGLTIRFHKSLQVHLCVLCLDWIQLNVVVGLHSALHSSNIFLSILEASERRSKSVSYSRLFARLLLALGGDAMVDCCCCIGCSQGPESAMNMNIHRVLMVCGHGN